MAAARKPGSRPSATRWRSHGMRPCSRCSGAENTTTRQIAQASRIDTGCWCRKRGASVTNTCRNAASAEPIRMVARSVGGSQAIRRGPARVMPSTNTSSANDSDIAVMAWKRSVGVS